MGLSEQLKELFTVPTIETTTYRCTRCGARFDAAEESCLDCGSELEEITIEAIPAYRGPMH